MDAVGYSVEDSLDAFLVREETHESSSLSHLPEFPLQYIDDIGRKLTNSLNN